MCGVGQNENGTTQEKDFSGKESDAPADLHKLFLWLAAVWVVEAVVLAEQEAGSVALEVVSAERAAVLVGQGHLWEAQVY